MIRKRINAGLLITSSELSKCCDSIFTLNGRFIYNFNQQMDILDL